MQRIHIFGSKSGSQDGEGLWAIEYELGKGHAFRDFFSLMADPEWVFAFCEDNIEDVQRKFGYAITAEAAALELMKEGEALKAKIVSLARGDLPGQTLAKVFEPLHPSESRLVELQLSKAKISKGNVKKWKNPKLRIYGIRIDDKTFLVTGGAIKLTNEMRERPHTEEELRKMKRVKTWLKELGVLFREDLINLTEDE